MVWFYSESQGLRMKRAGSRSASPKAGKLKIEEELMLKPENNDLPAQCSKAGRGPSCSAFVCHSGLQLIE